MELKKVICEFSEKTMEINCVGLFSFEAVNRNSLLTNISPVRPLFKIRKDLKEKIGAKKSPRNQITSLKGVKKGRKRKNLRGKKDEGKKEKNLENWVSMEQVIRWLKKNQVAVDKVDQSSNSYEKINNYIYLSKRISASHVLRLANQLRLEKNLSPFLVEEITFW
jgi:hypothetical protein